MNNQKIEIAWSASLFVLGLATIIMTGTNLIQYEYSDAVIRLAGIADLLALPVFSYTTVKKMRSKNK